jgi:hypothetical protein
MPEPVALATVGRPPSRRLPTVPDSAPMSSKRPIGYAPRVDWFPGVR